MAAGIDLAERPEIHVDVEAEAMVAATPADPQAERGDLATVDIDPWSLRPRHCGDAIPGQQIDDRLLQEGHQPSYPQIAPPQIEQRIEDQLAGAVIGHLAAAIGGDDRDFARREQMLGLAVQALRENR